MTERVLSVLRAVREVAAEAQESGDLVTFLTELERVRLEFVLTHSAPPTNEDDGDRLLTPRQTADRMGVSIWWVRDNKDALPIVRLSTGCYRFSEKGLERWIKRRALG
jgi:hypothetical protein